MKRILFLVCCMVATSMAPVAHAQHSDVEFGYDGGMIDIEFGAEGRIFEGDFVVGGLFDRTTDDPGWASELSEGLGIGAGDLVGYNVLENLFYWDGTAEAATTASITFDHFPAIADNVVSQSGSTSANVSFTGTLTNVIDQADGAGEFHQHIDWSLSAGSPTGAYGVLLDLETDAAGIANSESFGVIWNFGLNDTQFEAGVDHFVTTRNLSISAVPEPGSAMLLLAGGASAMLLRRRRR